MARQGSYHSMNGMKALLVAGYSSRNLSWYHLWVATARLPRNTAVKVANQAAAGVATMAAQPSHSTASPR